MTDKLLRFLCEAKVSLPAGEGESAAQSSGCIEARVTTWGPREGADGRRFNYQPEGFAAWAKEFADAGKPLPMFLNHNDMGMPVGQWESFTFDDEGMTASGKLFTNTSAGADLYSVLKESPALFGGVSVGAYADEYQWVKEDGTPMTIGSDDPYEDGYFQITRGGLREVSVVMYPNNPAAEIQKLECFDAEGNPNPRQIEKVLREAGLSKADAVTASSILKRIIAERDAPQATAEETAPTQSDSVEVNEVEILAALEAREILAALNSRTGVTQNAGKNH